MTARVIAFRPRALGDVVLVTPALRSLAAGLGGRVDVVTEARYADLLRGLPFVGEVFEAPQSPGGTWALARTLASRRYEVAVDFFGNPRSAFLASGSRAPVRAGYDLRGRRNAYTVRVARTQRAADGRREHASETHRRLARAAGGADASPLPGIALPERARADAVELLARAGVANPARAIGLCAAGTWASKTWPASHAASLAALLIRSGREVVALLGPGEERVGETLSRHAAGLRVLPPCGVAQLAAVIERVAAVVGTDSGPRHLAAALGVPSFAWFGPTHPENWNPPDERHAYWFTDVPCRGCDLTSCPHWTCMTRLRPETAFDLVVEHLERHGSPARLDSAARA